MDTKSLSSCQIRWAQELLKYYFRIDYCQSKANRAINALSCFPQRNFNKEKKAENTQILHCLQLQAENTQILHCLQSSLIRASLLGLSLGFKLNLPPLNQVFICGTYILPQLCQFWETFQTELADKKSYKASIGGMRLRLAEFQESDKETQKIRAEGLDRYKDVNRVVHHQGLPFVPEIIRTKLISWHYNDPLAGHFSIDKPRELIRKKYY